MSKICRTCGVEHDDNAQICRICTDERQWVPADGQAWTGLAELAGEGHRVRISDVEPDLYALEVEPSFAIGHRCHLIRTPNGCLLWDPVGFVDDAVVEQIRQLGRVVAIAASHPHHFGAQVAWSRALGGVPVRVSEADLEWVARRDPVIQPWAGKLEIVPGLTLTQVGGHFPGSAVAVWAAGANGNGVLLSADTVHTNRDRATVTFMRSYPNRIPLSAAVVARISQTISGLVFDRIYDNFGQSIASDARVVTQRSAERYIGWVRGDFDHLT
ncbi:MBL fold metallo-hydrolase [Nocardia anaemiae]|uniref:MBL fold metallo-hydrolase n=1 Tax=Nocardia anaemiae TaxID=263910 RepID=UPI0007A3D4EA|nr:MBL fold metallo-hydrolase [Nocardia anaemiae]